MPSITSPEHRRAAGRARDLLATWAENEELIRLGAYRRGTSAEVDEAIEARPGLDAWLRQDAEAVVPFGETVDSLGLLMR
jgi:flagellum-specific ATP synthase